MRAKRSNRTGARRVPHPAGCAGAWLAAGLVAAWLICRPAWAEQPPPQPDDQTSQAAAEPGLRTAEPADARLSTPLVKAPEDAPAQLRGSTDGPQPGFGEAEPESDVDSELDRARFRRALREAPVEEQPARRAEDDPYAPIGLRLGGFTLKPSLETGLLATSNATDAAGGQPGLLSETTLRLSGTGGVGDATAGFDSYGTFLRTLSGETLKESSVGLRGSVVMPLGNELSATAALAYSGGPESGSAPGVAEDAAAPAISHDLLGELMLAKEIGRARLSLDGSVERQTFGEAALADGASLPQQSHDNTLAELKLRAGYAISPALTPFAEIELGRRFYDQATAADDDGRPRSNVLGGQAGLAFDFGEKLSGSLAAGWLSEKPDDRRLAQVSGPQVDGSLAWSPQRGTMVRLDGTTTLEDDGAPGESGSILYAGRLSVERQLRANLTATAAIGAGYRTYAGTDGHDRLISAEAGGTYWLNRTTGLVARARHERQVSDLPDRTYNADSVYLGLKLQR